MNQKRIWEAWQSGLNTAEIARHIEPPIAECQVETVIWRCMNAVYYNRIMPWGKT